MIGLALEPELDRPVLANPTTAMMVELRARLLQPMWYRVFWVAVFLAAAVADAVMHGLGLGPLYFFAAAVITTKTAVLMRRERKRFEHDSELLANAYWKPAAARVIHGAGLVTKLWVALGSDWVPVQVKWMTGMHRAVLRRTGRVWLVGPDERGLVLVRVEGSHYPFSGSVLTEVPAERPADKKEPTDPTVAAARNAAQSLTVLGMQLLGVLVFTLVVANSGDEFDLPVFVGVVGTGWGILFFRLYQAWRPGNLRQLPGLVAEANWVRVGVVVDPFEPRRLGAATATATVRSDGDVSRIVLPHAGVDLLGTMHETGVVWISGPFRGGGPVAVGYPGYPLVAAARVRR